MNAQPRRHPRAPTGTRGPGTRALAALLLAGLSTLAFAADRQATLTVMASVVPRASFEALGPVFALTLTEADVARGYKDVDARFRVRANDPRGVLVRIAPRSGITESVEVHGFGSDVVLRGDIVEIHHVPGVGTSDLQLQFRMRLNDEAVAGRYPMPAQVTVATL